MCHEMAVLENVEEMGMGDTKGRWQKPQTDIRTTNSDVHHM